MLIFFYSYRNEAMFVLDSIINQLIAQFEQQNKLDEAFPIVETISVTNEIGNRVLQNKDCNLAKNKNDRLFIAHIESKKEVEDKNEETKGNHMIL